MSKKFGRIYELAIYPAQYIKTSVPGNSFVDSLKSQVSSVFSLLQQIQSSSVLNLSLLNSIQSEMTQVTILVQSLQSALGIPAAVINGLQVTITQQVASLISNVENATIVPVPFLNSFKNSAINQLNILTSFIPQIPSPFTSFSSFNSSNNSQPVVIKNPFTLIFNIRRAQQSSSNIGNFQIYNLSQTTRTQLYKDRTGLGASRRMTLKAGYTTDAMATIFDGNIQYCVSSRTQGQTNFITEIQAFDYGFVRVNAYTSKTWQGLVSKQDIVNQLIADIINSSPPDHPLSKGYIHQYTETQYNRTLAGNSWDLLCEETQNMCSIDCGKINILLDDDCFTGAISTIDSSTGLLGSPKRSDTWTEIELLFEPSLVVGQTITLNSSSSQIYNGVYKIIGINHFGTISDAVGGKCQSNISLYNYTKNQQLIGPSV